MGILGLGCDFVMVSRILQLMKRRGSDRLASRILSRKEMSDWQLQLSRSQAFDSIENARFLSVRWAVKEASYKALYPDFKPTWKELTYRSKTKNGSRPCLIYTPRTEPITPARSLKLHCSVTHDGDFSFATVLVENTSS
ncbi:hypothetical protein E1B28_004422 [Marasmius oreades]|uniref:4'-phosphopantetheinyl transferase domain-containing protein n=1 Tax=Marasmius oreades TaxID=181124 RepID=A0A9P7UYI9_9AGAR|nr:uncharacterized protein E1B28_004422 [Marasmius oreades]KAG7097029.1 hypothetical protein E1B28_004422 [Marasmius oreades]